MRFIRKTLHLFTTYKKITRLTTIISPLVCLIGGITSTIINHAHTVQQLMQDNPEQATRMPLTPHTFLTYTPAWLIWLTLTLTIISILIWLSTLTNNHHTQQGATPITEQHPTQSESDNNTIDDYGV